MFQDFEQQNNSTQIPVQKVFDDNQDPDNIAQALDVNEDNVHYMPDRFMTPVNTKNENKNWLTIIIIIIVVFVLIAVSAFVFYVYSNKKEDNSNNLLNLPQGQSITATSTIETQELLTPLDRDKKRIEDIFSIASALSLYFKDNGRYPNSLNALSQYLKTIPENPSPGGEQYFYQPLSGSTDYILIFILEEGGEKNGLILRSGKYQFTPKFGLESYKEAELDLNQNTTNTSTSTVNSDNEEVQLPVIPPKGIDSDNDGLTDSEEQLFSSNNNNSDTDADTHQDGVELKGLYDPTVANEKLVNNINLVRVYNNEANGYSLMYPAKWTVEEDVNDNLGVGFYSSSRKDFFKIQIKDNPQGMTLRSWYLNYSPSASQNDLQSFVTKNGDVGIKSKDGFNVFLSHDNKIYILSYILANTESLDYFSTFEMFANSFKFIKNNN